MDVEVDPQRPSAARIYDWFLGGTHNFAADRQAAAVALAAMPELPLIVRANRAFLVRAVTAAAEAGIDQFLDLGAGIPAAGPVHEVARRVLPRARVVYVDVEPVAVVHVRRLFGADPDVGTLLADLTEAPAVLAAEEVRRLIDPSRPVCLLLLSVAHFIPDTERLGRALDEYRRVLAPGSMMLLSHGAAEGDPRRAERLRTIYNSAISPMVLRDRDEVRALAGDWPLVEPGLTTAGRWRPGGDVPADEVVDLSLYALAARKRQT